MVLAALAGAALVACGLRAVGTGESVGGPGAEADADARSDVMSDDGLDGAAPLTDGGAGSCPGRDISTDPKNCGACGHDCRGGACKAGSCQPFRIGMLDASATSIAVNDSGVYWVVQSGAAVLACPADGCVGKPGVLAGSLTNTVALVDIGGTLAVLADVDLQAVTTPAGATVAIYPPSPTTMNNSFALCTDGTGHAYLAASSGTPFVERIVVDGGNAQRLVSSNNIDAVGCGAGHVLWEINQGTDSIYSCEDPADCGAFATIAPGANGGETRIAATTEQAYFTRRQAGTLNRCSIAGCFAPTVLYSGNDLNGVAVDAKYVYFTSGKGGVVARCEQDGCGGASLRQLAVNQPNPHALLVTKDAVYWATDALPPNGSDAGTPPAIWRIGK